MCRLCWQNVHKMFVSFRRPSLRFPTYQQSNSPKRSNKTVYSLYYRKKRLTLPVFGKILAIDHHRLIVKEKAAHTATPVFASNGLFTDHPTFGQRTTIRRIRAGSRSFCHCLQAHPKLPARHAQFFRGGNAALGRSDLRAWSRYTSTPRHN